MDLNGFLFPFILLICVSSMQCQIHYINCQFRKNPKSRKINQCVITEDLNIHDENHSISIQSSGNLGLVDEFFADGKEIFYLPNGIENFMPSLTIITITKSKLKKITSQNLKSFPKLENLDLSSNEIEKLGANLFQYNENLATINFDNNKISVIDPTIFSYLEKKTEFELKVNLLDNYCISKDINLIDSYQQVLTEMDKIKLTCWVHYDLGNRVEDLRTDFDMYKINNSKEITSINQYLSALNAKDQNLATYIQTQSLNIVTLSTQLEKIHALEEKITQLQSFFNRVISSGSDIILEPEKEHDEILIAIFPDYPLHRKDLPFLNTILIGILFILVICLCCCRRSAKLDDDMKVVEINAENYERFLDASKSGTLEMQPRNAAYKSHAVSQDNLDIHHAGNFFHNDPNEYREVIGNTDDNAMKGSWSVVYNTQNENSNSF